MRLTWILAVVLAAGAVAQTPEAMLGAALHQERVTGNLQAAIDGYRKVLAVKGVSRMVAAQAQYHIGICYEKLGDQEARKAFESVVKNYGDQRDFVSQARARLAAMGGGGGTQLLARRVSAGKPACFRPEDGSRLYGCVVGKELVITELQTGKEHRVALQGTTSPVMPGMASPDGLEYAYVETNQERVENLYVVKPGAGPSRKLGPIGALLAWAPDGKAVLVSNGAGGREDTGRLELVQTSDGTRKALGGGLKHKAIEKAVFSPNGEYIAHEETAWNTPAEIRVLTIATGAEQVVVADGDPRVVGWHKDGWLLFTAKPTGPRDLYRVRMNGGKPSGSAEILHRDLDVRLIWMNKGGNVYYMAALSSQLTYRATLNPSGTGLSAAPGLVSKRFVDGSRSGRYSHDGKRIAFDAGLRGRPMIVIQNAETGEEQERASPFERIQALAWYPDGNSLLVHGRVQIHQPFGFHRYDLRTGEVKTVLEMKGLGGDLATNPTFSADGQSLYFKLWDEPAGFDRNDLTRAYVARMDLKTGQVADAFRPQKPAALRLLAISPDATQIAYGYRDGSKDAYGVAELKGGTTRVVFECKEKEFTRGYSGIAFSGDGKGLLVHKAVSVNPTPEAPARDADQLWYVPLDGSAPSMIHNTGGWVLSISARPNSREIVWHAGQVRPPEFWMMENVSAPGAASR